MNKSELVAGRPGIEDDKAFIFSTWLKGLRFGNAWFKAIDQDTYFRRYHDVIEAVLNGPAVFITVACLKDQPDVILGYSVVHRETLDWTFVKKDWRSIGLLRDLIPTNITKVSHLTDVGKAILTKHPTVKFDPWDLT